MVTTTKYKAKYVFWDLENRTVKSTSDIERYRQKDKLTLPEHIIRFDSQHEFKVYLELCRMYGTERVLRQYKLRVVPPCCSYPNGKFWRVDFAIKEPPRSENLMWYVEAKGMVTTEFEYTLALMESNRAMDFCDLVVVFPSKVPTQNRLIKNLLNSDFQTNLLTLHDLKKRSFL